MAIKALFDWMLGRNIIRQRPASPKPHGGLIECHDCHTLGHIAVYGLGDYTLPPGWAMAWNWLKPLYTCPACGEKRRKWVREHILNRP